MEGSDLTGEPGGPFISGSPQEQMQKSLNSKDSTKSRVVALLQFPLLCDGSGSQGLKNAKIEAPKSDIATHANRDRFSFCLCLGGSAAKVSGRRLCDDGGNTSRRKEGRERRRAVIRLAGKAESGSNVHLFWQTETTGPTRSGTGPSAEIRVKCEICLSVRQRCLRYPRHALNHSHHCTIPLCF